jgi:DNA polymerase-1
MGILIVGEAPGRSEDELSTPFMGDDGRSLKDELAEVGVSLDNDCVRTNVLGCRPPDNREPTDTETACCKERLHKQIRDIRPELILALGTPAIKAVLHDAPFSPTATEMHGLVVPSNYWNAWVCCSYHPRFFLHGGRKDQILMRRAFRAGLDKLAKGYSNQMLDENKYEILEDLASVRRLFSTLGSRGPVSFDYETTSLDPLDPQFKFVSVAFADSTETGWCIPLEHVWARWSKQELAEVYRSLKDWVSGPSAKIIQNWQYEEMCSMVQFGVHVNNVVRDTMIYQHVLDNRTGICSLGFQTYVRYGTTYKTAVDPSSLVDTPLDQEAKYNVLDCRYTYRLYKDQDVESTPQLRSAYQQLHQGIPVMSTLTRRGLKLDMVALNTLEKTVTDELGEIASTRQTARCLSEFKQVTGHEWSSTSNKDKSELFFKHLQLKPMRATAGGGLSVDSESLEYLLTQVSPNSEAGRLISGLKNEGHLQKLLGTYVRGLAKLADGHHLIHPQFHLHTVETYRSSSSGPNFQNIPIRNKTMSRVRRGIVPKHDLFLEADVSGSEIRWIAHCSQCRTLITEIKNNVNQHRYWASRLFDIQESACTKDQRQEGKSSFVFPEFYGSYYVTIARNMGLDEDHVHEVEGEFWQRYADARRWQDGITTFYNRNGYIENPLGFRMYGPLTRNEQYNFIIQGLSFLRVLAALVEIEAEMLARGLRSEIDGQIHDSIFFDCVEAELDIVIDIIKRAFGHPAWVWDNTVPVEIELKCGTNMLDLEQISV